MRPKAIDDGRSASASRVSGVREAVASRDPASRDEAEAPMLAGQAVLDTRWAFTQVLGHDALMRALARLPDGTREDYERATPMSWVSYETIRAVHDAFAREAGEPIEALLDRAVPLALERSFKTVWRLLLRFTSDEALIARAPLLYQRTRSRGTMSARIDRPGVGVCELKGWASVPSRDVHALTISIRSFLELAGRQGVTVVGERTASGARFRVTWKI